MSLIGRIFGHHSSKTKKNEKSEQDLKKTETNTSVTSSSDSSVALSTTAAGVGSKFDSGSGLPSGESVPSEDVVESKPKKKSFFSRIIDRIKKHAAKNKKSDESLVEVLTGRKASTTETNNSTSAGTTATDTKAATTEAKDSVPADTTVTDTKAETTETKDSAKTNNSLSNEIENKTDSFNLDELKTTLTDLKIKLTSLGAPYVAGSPTLFSTEPQTIEAAESQIAQLEERVANFLQEKLAAEAKPAEKES